MRCLLIGSGGREAAMAHALGQSKGVEKLVISPGSDGIAEFGELAPAMSGEECAEFCKKQEIDLVVFGGETELVAGQADILREKGVNVLGPSALAAQLEGSKDFLKSLLFAANVPCARSKSFTDLAPARAYLATCDMPIVLKTDGLAGGKGVVIATKREEAEDWLERYLSGEAFGDAGKCVVIEDYLEGEEISYFVLVDAKGTAHPLGAARDHKRIYDGDQGPNTGGMGAYSPLSDFTPALQAQIDERIIKPTLLELSRQGTPFTGFLFAGLMLTSDGPKLLEYNIRLGDPEAQVILARLGVDFARLCHEAAMGGLSGDMREALKTPKAGSVVNIVLAAKGYPEDPQKFAKISGLDELKQGVDFFHAGTLLNDGAWRVGGGRVLNILGRGKALAQARRSAYAKCEQIDFDGMQFRKDIGGSKHGNS